MFCVSFPGGSTPSTASWRSTSDASVTCGPGLTSDSTERTWRHTGPPTRPNCWVRTNQTKTQSDMSRCCWTYTNTWLKHTDSRVWTWGVWTWGVDPPVLCHLFMERLICLSCVQICVVWESKIKSNKHEILVHLKPTNTLRQKLVHPDDRTPRNIQRDVVYVVQCIRTAQICTQTKQPWVQTPQIQTPQVLRTNHSCEDNNVNILSREDTWFERGVIIVIIYVKLEQPSLIRGGGLQHYLSPTYNAVLSSLPKWVRVGLGIT